MPSQNPYQLGLDKNAANYVPLTPLTFIRRTADVYPERTAVIHGGLKRTWKQTYERCVRLGSALSALQGAQNRGLRTFAQDVYGQAAEVQAARPGQSDLATCPDGSQTVVACAQGEVCAFADFL